MPKFTVQTPVEHDQKRYEVGAEITLPDDQAEPLLALAAIVPFVKAAKPPASDDGNKG